jgi:hypothetical protein
MLVASRLVIASCGSIVLAAACTPTEGTGPDDSSSAVSGATPRPGGSGANADGGASKGGDANVSHASDGGTTNQALTCNQLGDFCDQSSPCCPGLVCSFDLLCLACVNEGERPGPFQDCCEGLKMGANGKCGSD